MANNKNNGGFVYSTNPDFSFDSENESEETLSPQDQRLSLHRETKGRGGKAVVIVRGFVGNDEDLQQLSKQLKAHCGTGGSVKDGEIIIQGDQREKVSAYLTSKGYQCKRVGG